MAETDYTYSVATATLSGSVDCGNLELQITRDATVTETVVKVVARGDALVVTMLNAITKVDLDTIVAAHDGTPEETPSVLKYAGDRYQAIGAVTDGAYWRLQFKKL